MTFREQGAKARLCVLHYGEELFKTVGDAKHGYDALNMRNVVRKIPRRELGRCRGRKTVEKSCRTSHSVHHCTVAPPTPSARGRGVVKGKSKGAANILKSADSGSTSSGTHATRRGNCSN